MKLASAVIPAPGDYRYRFIGPTEAKAWLQDRVSAYPGPWISRISYAETAAHIREIAGIDVPLSREATAMAPGDVALVVRLRYRVADPGAKGRVAPGPDDWEYGILTMSPPGGPWASALGRNGGFLLSAAPHKLRPR